MIIRGVNLGGATYKGSGPIDAVLTLSPAVSGNTTWSLLNAGPLTLNAGTIYTITNNTARSYSFTVKLWGAGGGGSQGGFTTGSYTLNAGSSVKALAGSAATPAAPFWPNTAIHGGGGASAIYSSTNDATVYAVAGGGGGGEGQWDSGILRANGGNGGGATGGTGGSTTANGGAGGTQSAGGAGGTGARGNGIPGSFRNGGGGAGDANIVNGGAGWGTGGYGRYNAGDGTAGGGGGGYYGGGGGGAFTASGGGGGGSSYIGGLTSGSMTQGYGSDPARGTAGNPVSPGKIVLSV
jgi:hypothetical protein